MRDTRRADVEPTGIFNRPNVLLIDDCVEQRDLYEFALAHDFNILTAARGAEGASLAARERPDAIILDVLMPGMDGWETCTHIKCNARTAHIPVILLTGTNDRDLSQHAIAVGATAVLTKPCSADRLRDAIRVAMSQAAPERRRARPGS
jgi:CheY-like chemotaxis protein